MLAAFFETFMVTFLVFVAIEVLFRVFGIGVLQDQNDTSSIEQELENAIVLCKIEQIDSVFYFYDAQDDNFVGQARTMNDIEEISERLQKHIIVVDGDENVLSALKKVTNEISISK